MVEVTISELEKILTTTDENTVVTVWIGGEEDDEEI